jgi:hypothetical protein
MNICVPDRKKKPQTCGDKLMKKLATGDLSSN